MCRFAYGPADATVSCFSKIQIGFTFLVQAHLGSPGQRAIKRVCVCVCVSYSTTDLSFNPKEFWKSVNIWQSYGQYTYGSALFFMTHSVYDKIC